MTIPLSNLGSGRSAMVMGVSTGHGGGGGGFRQRLMALGLVPGTAIEHVMTSPAGDPVCYRVRGAMIALRSSDAEHIHVQV